MDAKYDTFFAARDGNKKIEVVSEPQWRSKWLIIRATRALEMAASNLQGFPNWLLDHALGPRWPSKVKLEITVRKDASIRLAF